MNVTEIVTTAVATLLVMVMAHLAVYWVVKTLYPPLPAAPQPEPMAPRVTFAEPPKEVPVPEDVERVVLPTYEAPVPAEAPRETGERRGPPPAESTSIRGDSRVAPADAQRSG